MTEVFLIIPSPFRGCTPNHDVYVLTILHFCNHYIKSCDWRVNHPFDSIPYRTIYPFFYSSNNQSRCAGRSEDNIDGQESQNALSFVHTRALSTGRWWQREYSGEEYFECHDRATSRFNGEFCNRQFSCFTVLVLSLLDRKHLILAYHATIVTGKWYVCIWL